QELDQAEFFGPQESLIIENTGQDATYEKLGFTFHRARFDDWLRSEAETAGADYRVGYSVASVDTTINGNEPRHTIKLQSGDEIEAQYLILADGPQRQVTINILDKFLPDTKKASKMLSPPHANHIAYQEHRRIPSELFDPNSIKFWWGWIPGETAYPWIFPNDNSIARVGLTMPINLDLSTLENREAYRLLQSDDKRVPNGSVYIRRLLENLYGDEYDIDDDFPIIEDRGKNKGTETYPISSTRPIESPVEANIAVTGGAMGGTSAFHEGGDHIAVSTGKIAGRLAANNQLNEYNKQWKIVAGEEIKRNIAIANIVRGYTPSDWDRAFRIARRLLDRSGLIEAATAGLPALQFYLQYKKQKFNLRNGQYVQIRESDYQYVY
ncbi:MAG: NAD(P)/FAD-dependent oxidoreductase, partial [Halobacteriaceae archaeon]